MSDKPTTARSYRTSTIDDNAIISLNIKWLGQILFLCGALVYGYWSILNRIEKLEIGMAESDEQIQTLVKKHIEEEQVRFNKMEQEIQWYQKEFNLNPLSWKKKRGKK